MLLSNREDEGSEKQWARKTFHGWPKKIPMASNATNSLCGYKIVARQPLAFLFRFNKRIEVYRDIITSSLPPVTLQMSAVDIDHLHNIQPYLDCSLIQGVVRRL